MSKACADLAHAAARALRELPGCGAARLAAGPCSLRDVEWIAGARKRVDADGLVVVRDGLAIFVEDGLPAELLAHHVWRELQRFPAPLRVANAVHVMAQKAPGRASVNANAHVESGTLWFWSPRHQPLLDTTTLAHELAHLLVPEPGHGHDAE